MTIIDKKLELPKNAKLFEDIHKNLAYAVHYNHVVLVIDRNKNEILDLYCASATSKDVIYRVCYNYGINIDIQKEYERLGKGQFKRFIDIYDYGYQENGYYYPERFKKSDWNERIEALESFDYTQGLRLI